MVACTIAIYSNKTITELACVLFFLAEFLKEHKRILENRLQPIAREITDYRARTREELESLYITWQVLLYCILPPL